jgi:uncharacterized protein YjiS (DUF1127 family)
MSYFTRTDELALMPSNRTSYPESYRQPARGFFASLSARVSEALQRRKTLSELNSLSNRELADIGLTRPEIAHVFDHAFARSR